ncbi:MAG: ATP-dependent Clp protease ATP-binding subunit [Clostridia bacterium]|nr:ATP-dependent Clp protease ATP-binding subunit [Clostridia bacterium]
MMMRLSERSGGVLVAAYRLARSFGLNYLGTEHLLAGIMEEDSGYAGDLLNQSGLTIEKIKTVLQQMNSQKPDDSEPVEELEPDKIMAMFTPRTRRVMELAAYESRVRHSDIIQPEHLLMGMIREGESVAMRILRSSQIDPRKLYAQLTAYLSVDNSGTSDLSGERPQEGGGSEDPEIAEKFRRDVSDVLRRPSTLKRITGSLWKNYSHHRKITGRPVPDIQDPTVLRNVTTIARELMIMEREATEEGILFGTAPVTMRKKRTEKDQGEDEFHDNTDHE